MNKTIIRKEIYEKRRKLNKIFVETNSKNIFINLCKTKVFDFKNILVYSDFKNEVQTGDIIKSLLENKKNVFLPICNIETNTFTTEQICDVEFDAQLNFYGIKEPIKKENSNQTIDCAIIPGIAFDANGNRIGFGKGYYDKFFEKNQSVYKIGLCYEFQIVDSIDVQEHDFPVDLIVTENRVIEIHRK